MFDTNRFTKKELLVLACLADGLTNKEMAHLLSVSTRTIETHVAHIEKKTGVHGARKIAIVAYKLMNDPVGMISQESVIL